MEKLLTLLYDNARHTNAELAVMMGISEDQVAREIETLESRGIIKGYKPLINWEKVDKARVSAFIEIKVVRKRDAGFEELASKIMRFDEVESIHLMSGGFDFAVTVNGRTFQEVAMFVAKRLAVMENVMSTATHFVLRRYKDMGVELINEQDDDRGMLSF